MDKDFYLPVIFSIITIIVTIAGLFFFESDHGAEIFDKLVKLWG